MDESLPLGRRMARGFLVQQLGASNRFVNELLDDVKGALVAELPKNQEKIAAVIARFRSPFDECLSLVPDNPRTIKLPVSVQIRENGQEQRDGVYAVNLGADLGIDVLEEGCRAAVELGADLRLIEARRFERDLDCFCTIPRSLYATELIEGGAKYELVFEKRPPTPPQSYATPPTVHSHRSAASSNPIERINSLGDFRAAPMVELADLPPARRSHRTGHSATASVVVESMQPLGQDGNLLEQLFGRDSTGQSSPRTDSPANEASSSAMAAIWNSRDEESIKSLPDFDVMDIFRSDERGEALLAHIRQHPMKNLKSRILGRFFMDEIKPRLATAVTAALRRAFIEKVFRDLGPIVKPLPEKELFSNRLGNGWLDVFLKHQNSKAKRRQQHGATAEVRQVHEMDDFQLHALDPSTFSFPNESTLSPLRLSPLHEDGGLKADFDFSRFN
ncbi:hypothetical protein M3Y99_01499400 [Aphelenchoides fujianensis]|nr:hypothetical protein M3Y99_01499400 [Aphelenchoides fujianensis]